MKAIRWAALLFVCVSAGACSGQGGEPTETASSQLVVNAVGAVPGGLPPRMMVGLFESAGGTWMKGSGVPWDVRYAYFTYGWANNCGYGAHDGSWGLGSRTGVARPLDFAQRAPAAANHTVSTLKRQGNLCTDAKAPPTA